MSLNAGTRLGTYEILSSLGAGGMGEVYRARDTRLGRDVAVKVLPQAVAASAERLARFEREAKTVASLNHPNIITLHSIEEASLWLDWNWSVADSSYRRALRLAPGNADLAFSWLERAFAGRDPGLAEVKVEPLLRSLHGDPRWTAFLREMGFSD